MGQVVEQLASFLHSFTERACIAVDTAATAAAESCQVESLHPFVNPSVGLAYDRVQQFLPLILRAVPCCSVLQQILLWLAYSVC